MLCTSWISSLLSLVLVYPFASVSIFHSHIKIIVLKYYILSIEIVFGPNLVSKHSEFTEFVKYSYLSCYVPFLFLRNFESQIAPHINPFTRWRWVVRFTLGPVYRGKNGNGTHWIGAWGGPRTDIKVMMNKKSILLPGIELIFPHSSQSVYWLGCSSYIRCFYNKIQSWTFTPYNNINFASTFSNIRIFVCMYTHTQNVLV
jgi:hypothetical protein